MLVRFSPDFDRQFIQRLTARQRIRALDAIELFQDDPFHRDLRNHSLKGEWFGHRSISILDLRKIARSQGKSARAESGLTEGEVAIATSREDRPLSAEISWSGDGGALRKSSIGGDLRMHFQMLDSTIAYFVAVGTHSQLYG